QLDHRLAPLPRGRLAEPRRCSVQSLASDRSVRRAGAAHAAGQRRKPAVPQSEARRHAGVAVWPGCGQGDGDSQSTDARRDRDRARWRGRQKASAASAHTALVLHPQRGGAARLRRAARSGRGDDRLGSVRRPRPVRPALVPLAEGQALEAGAALEDARRLHHGRLAALRGGHQPYRRHYHRLSRLAYRGFIKVELTGCRKTQPSSFQLLPSDITFRTPSVATSIGLCLATMAGHDRCGIGRTAEYQQPLEQVLGALGSNRQRGLSAAEAKERLHQYGPNELAAEPPVPGWRRFLAQFRDVLVILLLVATAISVSLWLYERNSALPYE